MSETEIEYEAYEHDGVAEPEMIEVPLAELEPEEECAEDDEDAEEPEIIPGGD